MIKLVASDLDGTLLLNGAQSVEDSMFETIGKLLDRGILFAPASGRQMTSLKRLFAPVAEELVYISENGALVSYKGKTIAKTPMKRELIYGAPGRAWTIGAPRSRPPSILA